VLGSPTPRPRGRRTTVQDERLGLERLKARPDLVGYRVEIVSTHVLREPDPCHGEVQPGVRDEIALRERPERRAVTLSLGAELRGLLEGQVERV